MHLYLNIDSGSMASSNVVPDDEFEEHYHVFQAELASIESLVHGVTLVSEGREVHQRLYDNSDVHLTNVRSRTGH